LNLHFNATPNHKKIPIANFQLKLVCLEHYWKEDCYESYKHLTIFERERIFLLSGQGMSIRQIVLDIGRSPSTVSRKLKRNRKNKTYSPVVAQTMYFSRKQTYGRKSLLSSHKLWRLVRILFIEEQWAPEEIFYRIKQIVLVSQSVIQQSIGEFIKESLKYNP